MMNLEKMQPMPNAAHLYPQMPMQPPALPQQQQQQLGVQHFQPQPDNGGMNYQLPQQDLRSNTISAAQRPPTSNVIVVSNNASLPLGHEPQRMTCPQCNVKMLTRLDYRCSYRTHLIALAFCVTGLFCFVPLPYCMKSCQNLDHYCSNCDQYMGNIKM